MPKLIQLLAAYSWFFQKFNIRVQMPFKNPINLCTILTPLSWKACVGYVDPRDNFSRKNKVYDARIRLTLVFWIQKQNNGCYWKRIILWFSSTHNADFNGIFMSKTYVIKFPCLYIFEKFCLFIITHKTVNRQLILREVVRLECNPQILILWEYELKNKWSNNWDIGSGAANSSPISLDIN